MRIVLCVKWVPALGSLRFDPETRRLVREGVPGEVSSFDLRALGAAVALRAVHGAERETDEGFETVTGPLPAVVTAAEDIAEECFPTKAERQVAAAKPIASLGAAEVGLAPDDVGARGSPTWVAGIEHVPSARLGEMLAGDSPETLARALGERLRALAPPRDDRPALPARGAASGPPGWVVAELGPRGPKAGTAEP